MMQKIYLEELDWPDFTEFQKTVYTTERVTLTHPLSSDFELYYYLVFEYMLMKKADQTQYVPNILSAITYHKIKNLYDRNRDLVFLISTGLIKTANITQQQATNFITNTGRKSEYFRCDETKRARMQYSLDFHMMLVNQTIDGRVKMGIEKLVKINAEEQNDDGAINFQMDVEHDINANTVVNEMVANMEQLPDFPINEKN